MIPDGGVAGLILQRQAKEGWGAKVIDRLSSDLRQAFPDMKGFSPGNLKYMRAFAEVWPDKAIVQRVVAQLPWRQNIALLERLNDPEKDIKSAQRKTESLQRLKKEPTHAPIIVSTSFCRFCRGPHDALVRAWGLREAACEGLEGRKGNSTTGDECRRY
jgi:hypothetical protein